MVCDAQPGSRAGRECGGRKLNRNLRPEVASTCDPKARIVVVPLTVSQVLRSGTRSIAIGGASRRRSTAAIDGITLFAGRLVDQVRSASDAPRERRLIVSRQQVSRSVINREATRIAEPCLREAAT